MVYIVGLVEYGRATHVWRYNDDDYASALHQLRLLCEVYQDVHEICPTLLKVGAYEASMDRSLDTLLKQYSYVPKSSFNE